MKVKVTTADGSTVEGVLASITDPSDPPEGILLEDDFETKFNERFTRRASSLERKALEKAMADPAFKEQALTAWGINLAELAKGGEVNAEKLNKAMEEWRKRELEPVVAERDGLKGRVESFLAKKLDSDILAAAREVGIKKAFLAALTPGATPMIVAALRGQFGYDPEHDEFFEKDPKRQGEFAFSSKPTEGQPYRTIAERLRLFAEDKANADYLEAPQKARGPNLQGAGGGRGGDVVLTAEQRGNLAEIQAAEKLAAEQGGKVIYVD